MAEKLDPKALVTIEELAISNMWETSALVELLERSGKRDRLSFILENFSRDTTQERAQMRQEN